MKLWIHHASSLSNKWWICQAIFVESMKSVNILRTSIYDLVLLNVCHFRHHHIFAQIISIYRDTRAHILDLASRNFLVKCVCIIQFWLHAFQYSKVIQQLDNIVEIFKWYVCSRKSSIQKKSISQKRVSKVGWCSLQIRVSKKFSSAANDIIIAWKKKK